jgi:hypothetical protein
MSARSEADFRSLLVLDRLASPVPMQFVHLKRVVAAHLVLKSASSSAVQDVTGVHARIVTLDLERPGCTPG